MESAELKTIWEQIKSKLFTVLPENAHPWLTPVEVSGYDNGVFTLVTGQLMGRDILRKNHYKQIVDVIKEITADKNSDVVIIYDANAIKNIKKENNRIQKKIAESVLKEQAKENLYYMQSAANLNLKYKFENFVVGESNKFAHAVAMQVAKEPAKKYNPLFIYGVSGLGKTHLMQAIGHYVIFNNQKMKVRYTKTEDYVNDFISNSRNSKDTIENMSKFNKKYTNIDIILIDDIQFIESKIKTMTQMQHTFDSLYNKGKQIVITSDRVPKDIPTLTAALCSRFEMGLMVELVPPDLQTRINIIKKLADDNNIEYTLEALEYIAQNFSQNVRELEGAFNKASAYADLSLKKLDINVAREVLKCTKNETISLEKILKVTAEYFQVNSDDIKSVLKGQKLAKARHISIFLSRELTNKSFVNIADFYNKKHTTIMYAYEKIKKELFVNKELSLIIREIKQALKVI